MRSLIPILLILFLLACGEKVDPLGSLEMTVRKVVSVNGIAYDEIQIGVFPTESLITKDYSKEAAIVYQKWAIASNLQCWINCYLLSSSKTCTSKTWTSGSGGAFKLIK